MINNLPTEFPIKKLDDFDFGGAEAKTDTLITTTLGFCWTRPIHEFVKGKRNIVIGERGSGKSVLFKLLSEGKLQFKKQKGEHHLILPIEEELQYGALKDYVDKHVATFISEPSMKYRIVWELFFISRILAFLSNNFGNSLSEELKKANSHMSVVLGYQKAPVSLVEIVKGVKATIGLKLGTSHVGTVEPNVYGSVEQGSLNQNANADTNIDIDVYKRQVQQFLESKKTLLFVLVDKVDEFVVKSDYDVQRLLLQALMETEKSYMDFNSIKFKLFIRCDLYKRLEYDVLGADKFTAKKINLVWTNEDIRKFLAQRIMYNYFTAVGLKQLEIDVVNDKLYVDENSVETDASMDNASDDNYFKKALLHLFAKIKRKVHKKKSRQIEGRHTTLDDEISKEIITSVFPRMVKHMDRQGQAKELDVFDYFNTHFSLSSETTTPRLVVMFLDDCLSMAKDYYRNNNDEKVPLDQNGEYQLFKRNIVRNAYAEFRKEIDESFLNASSNWREMFARFTLHKSKRADYTLTDIHKILGIETDDVRRFIAFLCHIGYLKCHNPKALVADRKYSLPIMFQR